MTSDPLVLLLVGFVLTSGIGGLLGYLFQQRAWRHQHRVQREELLRDQALRTFEQVSTLLDQRLYRMRMVFWAARNRARRTTDNRQLNLALDDYRAALRVWNDNLNRNLALVDTYFGQQARSRLEYQLYEHFSAIGEELDVFVREVSRRGPEPVDVRPIGGRLQELSRSVYDFNVLLLRGVRDGRLGKDAPQGDEEVPPAGADLLRFGDRGAQVRRLQRALEERVAATVVADGHFGRGTERAVRAFQELRGLRTDGIAGRTTLVALELPAPPDTAAAAPAEPIAPAEPDTP